MGAELAQDGEWYDGHVVHVTDEHGNELARANDFIGKATNNEAEYRALLLGLASAVVAISVPIAEVKSGLSP